MVLAATVVEPFTESLILSLIGAYSCRQLLGVPPFPFILVHFTLWLSLDLDVYASIAGEQLKDIKAISFVVAWVMRELLALPIWVIAMVGNEVTWRGRSYKVLRNGEASLSINKQSSWLDFWNKTEPVYHQL